MQHYLVTRCGLVLDFSSLFSCAMIGYEKSGAFEEAVCIATKTSSVCK
jgi:hypothetical protein